MAWGKQKNGKTEETEQVQPTELPQTQEPIERTDQMEEELSELRIATEAAERFLEHAKMTKSMVANGVTLEELKKMPELRRLKRASLDLSSELVIMRKALP